MLLRSVSHRNGASRWADKPQQLARNSRRRAKQNELTGVGRPITVWSVGSVFVQFEPAVEQPKPLKRFSTAEILKKVVDPPAVNLQAQIEHFPVSLSLAAW